MAIKDIEASRKFYEAFGFQVFGGDAAQNWLILKNGDHVIGLFQGMVEKNMLTFNPGWDSNAQKLAWFTDVRELQRQLNAQGVYGKGYGNYTLHWHNRITPDGVMSYSDIAHRRSMDT